MHAHDLLVPARVLLAVPGALARSRGPHRRVLCVQPVRGREAARGVRCGAEAAGHGQGEPRAVHALLRALGGEREVAGEGEERPGGHEREQAEPALQLPVHAALPAQVRDGRPGADRGVPPHPQVDIRLRILLLRHIREPRRPPLLRVHAGQRGVRAGEAVARGGARPGQVHEPGHAPAGQPGGQPGVFHAGVPRRVPLRHQRSLRRLPLPPHRPHRRHQEPLPDASAGA
mmetsp:Transcript_17613/g.38423  ORF Transcript_17613/g.38423 Transcript_17613/m.38423 type:complete len:230 (-) Transcript_17613:575-1264(-)